jgi:hypothetical protein
MYVCDREGLEAQLKSQGSKEPTKSKGAMRHHQRVAAEAGDVSPRFASHPPPTPPPGGGGGGSGMNSAVTSPTSNNTNKANDVGGSPVNRNRVKAMGSSVFGVSHLAHTSMYSLYHGFSSYLCMDGTCVV